MRRSRAVISRTVRWALVALLMQFIPPAGMGVAAGADRPPSRADAYANEAGELLGQGKFAETADKYQLAAKEALKEPGGEAKANKYLANYNLYRAMAIYSEAELSGIFAQTDLDDAIRRAQQARDLFRQVRNQAGEQAAEGWRLFLVGVKNDKGSQFREAREAYEKARRVFLDLGDSAPEMRENTRQFVSLAERGAIWATTMDLMWNIEEYERKGGEINQLLAQLKKRVSAEQQPFYDGLEALSRGQRLFLEGSKRLESWDYRDAARVLPEAEKALAEAANRYGGLKESHQRGTLQSTVAGWAEATRAQQAHGRALQALLDGGDVGRSKAEFIDGVQRYRAALAAFEKAGFGASMSGAIQNSYTRLRDRAEIVAGAFGPTKAMLNVGRFFLVAFLGTLGVMTLLQPRLRLSGKQVLWISLVVGIIGAFGLRAPDILNALKSFPKVG